MGLLDRVNAAVAARRRPTEESRYSADQWAQQYLIPSQNQFAYNGAVYPISQYGLTTTYQGDRAKEISQTLPGYMAALRSCPPAFAAQSVRASVLSQARFCFRNADWSPKAGRTFTTSALKPLQQPWTNATTGQLINTMEWHVGLAGNAYVTSRARNRLRVLRPDWVVIVYGSQQQPDDAAHALDGEIIGYAYCNGGFGAGMYPVETLLPSEVAHWSPLPDPEGAGIGMSWITPAVREIQGDRAATDHKLQFFANGATPNLVVKGIPAATKDQFNDIVDNLEEKHRGVANAYRTLYLTAGADATVVGSDLAQIDFKATQGAGETRISMLSRVHPVVLAASEGMQGSSLNAGNFSAARRIWADTWIYPVLADLAAALSPLVRVPADAELWTKTGDMPILREDARDAADIEQVKATTIQQYISIGFTPASSVAAVDAQDVSLLVHTGLVSVQLQPPGSAPPTAGAPAVPGGARPKALPVGQRRFDPAEPRIPGGEHGGEWGHGVGHEAAELAKALKPREVSTDAGKWTASLNDSGGIDVHWPASKGKPIGTTISRSDADRFAGAVKGLIGTLDEADGTEPAGKPLATKVLKTKGGTFRLASFGKKYGEGTVTIEHDSHDWSLQLPDTQVENIGEQLLDLFDATGDLPDGVRAAVGHDTTPGHDELHHYWVAGPGRGEWAGSPKPFTTLVGLLVKHVKPPKPIETYRRWAAVWVHEVLGYWPGSDLNRVEHGKPPRGHKVGPG